MISCLCECVYSPADPLSLYMVTQSYCAAVVRVSWVCVTEVFSWFQPVHAELASAPCGLFHDTCGISRGGWRSLVWTLHRLCGYLVLVCVCMCDSSVSIDRTLKSPVASSEPESGTSDLSSSVCVRASLIKTTFYLYSGVHPFPRPSMTLLNVTSS